MRLQVSEKLDTLFLVQVGATVPERVDDTPPYMALSGEDWTHSHEQFVGADHASDSSPQAGRVQLTDVHSAASRRR